MREQGPASDDHAIVAPVDHFGAAQFDRRASALDRFSGGLGIADRDRTVVRQRELEHGARIDLVPRRHDDQVRKHAHVAHVEHAVMRGAVGAGQARAIEQERHRQILQRHFLKNLVVAALQEGAVDIDDRPQSGLGLAGGERHGVRFADARVEEPLGKCLANGLQLGALAHRGGQHRDLGIGFHLREDRLAEDVGVGLRRAFLESQNAFVLAGEGGRRVKVNRIFGGRLETVSFFGHDVQQHRARHVLDHGQILAQLLDVVAVDRADVAEVELLEQHAAVQAGFDRFLDLGQESLGRIAEQGHLVEDFEYFTFQAGVERVDPQPIEIFAQAAHARADRHLIVVENHQQLAAHAAGVVHRFVHDTRGESPVADDGHRVAVALSGHQVIAAFESQGGRNARAGMAGHEQVVGAFVRIGVAHQAPLGAHGGEFVVTAGDQFMRIDLVAGVPDQPVAAEIKGGVQRQAKLDHAQVRGEMRRAIGNQIAKHFAHLDGELFELGDRHALQIAGRLDFGEQLVHQCFLSRT